MWLKTTTINIVKMSESKDDRILIKNLASGDAYSFDELFHKYNRKVYDISLRNLKNREDAEGIVQDVFLSIWKNRAKKRIERSGCLDIHRKFQCHP
jgi:hypothetical protein